MYTITGLKPGPCTFCSKDGENFVTTCDKATFHDTALCPRCLQQLARMRANGKPKPAPALPAATPVAPATPTK